MKAIRSFARNTLVTLVIFLILRYLSSLETLKAFYTNVHDQLFNSFSSFLTINYKDNASLLTSILIGASNVKIDQNIYEQFRKFNLLHVVSISGANFIFISELITKLPTIFPKRIKLLITSIIQTYYIFTIGINNLPALRAYLFSMLTTLSLFSGRPTNFMHKLFITLIFVTAIFPEAITSLSLILSTFFALLYKLLSTKALNRIFNNDFKKITLTFLITGIIFGSENPDYLANIFFALTYPFIFIATYMGYIFSLFNIDLIILLNIVNLFINDIYRIMSELSTFQNVLIQALIYISIAILILRESLKRNEKLQYT